jgi:phosphoglucosamine mutase
MDQSFQPYPQKLVNVTVPDRARRTAWQECAPMRDAVAKAEAAMAGQGRVLVRASGTEPLLRVMVEASETEQVDHWTSVLAAEADRLLNAA